MQASVSADKTAKFRSARERRFRDQVMKAVAKKIWSERIPCAEIIISGRPMLTAVRARILRGEHDEISLPRAILIADAVGLDLADDIVTAAAPAPAVTPPAPRRQGPTLAQVLEQTRAQQTHRRSAGRATGMADLFAMLA